MDDKGEKRYNTWSYSNWGYSLVALCLQKVYGIRYHELLQQKILDPLRLDRTVVRKEDADHDNNIAHGTARLKDGTVVNLPNILTREDHTPMLSVMGMLSSVNDMLIWAKTILAAEKAEKEVQARQMPAYPPSNPLRYVSTTRGKAYWTRPSHDRFQNEIWYCLGWLKVCMPSSGLSSIGMNMRPRDDPVPENWIIGSESPKTEVLLHGGIAPGSSCMFYTFPETQSAIIVFASGTQDGCAADFTCQVLTQALLGSKPHVDLLPFARSEIERQRSEGYPKFWKAWHQNRDVSGEESARAQYMGDYQIGPITLSVRLEDSTDPQESLTVTFGGIPETKRRLEFYAKDVYSCFPETSDECLTEPLQTWGWETGILRFQRNGDGKIDSLIWKHAPMEGPFELKKVE
jgi:hypothetical protein